MKAQGMAARVLIVASTILAFGLDSVRADTRTFDGGGTNGAILDVAGNWSSDTIPVATDEALLDDSVFALPNSLTLSSSRTFGDLLLDSSSLTNVTLTGATAYTLTLGGGAGSTTALAAGGATGDLLLLGTNVHATVNVGGGASTGKLGVTLGADGAFDVANADAALLVSGILAGNYNLTKTGPGVLTLSGVNTWGAARTFTLSAGQLNVNSTTALGSGTDTFQINGGTTLDNASGAAITLNNNQPVAINGDFTFLGGSGTTHDLNLGAGASTLGTAAGTSRTITANAGTLTLGGIIANGASANALVKNGAGALTLSGANTFSGGVTLNTGTLKLGNAAALGAQSGTLTINGGTLDVTGNITVSKTNAISLNGDFAFGGSGALNLGTGNVDLGSAGGSTRTIAFNGNTLTVGGIISNGTTACGLVKAGTGGTLSLTAANAFTGGVVVLGGTLSGSLTGASLGNGGTIVLGDTTGSANTALSLNSNKNYNQPVVVQGGNTGTASLTLNNNIVYSGAIVLSNHDLTIAFVQSGTESVSGSSITGVGNLRVTNGNNNYPTLAHSIDIVGSISNTSVNTLREGIYLTGSQSTNVIDIVQNSTNIAFLLSGNNAYNGSATALLGMLWFQKYQAWSQNGGNVPGTPTPVVCSNNTTLGITYGGASGAFSDTTAASLFTHTTTGNGVTLQVDDGGSATSSNMATVISASQFCNLTRSGTSQGPLVLTGANTYTGLTTLAGGTLAAGSTENPGVSGPFGNPAIAAGSILFNGGRLGWSSGNTYDYSTSGRFAINSGKSYAFDSNGQDVTLAGALPTNGVNALSVASTGGGRIILAGNNTFSGSVTINNGTSTANLQVNAFNYVTSGDWAHHADGYSNLGAPTTAANGQITIGGQGSSSLTYAGTGETTDRNLVVGSTTGQNPVSYVDNSGTGLLKFIGTLSWAGGSGTPGFGLRGSAPGEISGVISGPANGPLFKGGTNTWTLSNTANTYMGTTTVTGGVLAVTKLANGGLPSSIGSNTSVAANLTINGGALRYIGTGDSMDRSWTLGNNNAAIDASGSGPLMMSGTNVYVTANAARTLTLTGTNTGANTYGGLLRNNGTGALSLVKDGPGTWVLTATHNYTGATIVSNGTLAINGSSISTTLVCNAAVLTGTGAIVTNNATAVTVAAGGILDPGSAGGIGTLTVTGNVVFADGAVFRVDANGTSADLLSVAGTVSGGPVLVKANAVGAGPWKIMTATSGITASFATDAAGYTVTKRNANTELWLVGRGGTVVFFQ